MMLIGLVVPIPFWVLHKYYPNFGADKVITPVLTCKYFLISVDVVLYDEIRKLQI